MATKRSSSDEATLSTDENDDFVRQIRPTGRRSVVEPARMSMRPVSAPCSPGALAPCFSGRTMFPLVSAGVVVLALLAPATSAMETCPNGLRCNERCCVEENTNRFFCCRDDGQIYFVAGWWRENSAVLIGCLIASVIVSVLLSLLCCFCCNGCWWYRRRNAGAVAGCLPGLPLATIIYNPNWSPWYSAAGPDGVNDANSSAKPRVHFEEDSLYGSYERLKPAIKKQTV